MKLTKIKHPSVFQQSSTSAPAGLPLPERIVLPLASPWGEARPLVSKGEQVEVGQCIASSDDIMVPPVHASASGTVAEIKAWPSSSGKDELSIVIETNGEQTRQSEQAANLEDPEAVFQKLLAAGIGEVESHPWPLALRMASPELIGNALSSPPDSLMQPVETLIINGMDRQPGVYQRSLLLALHDKEIVNSLLILQKLSSAKRSVLVVAKDQILPSDLQQRLSEARVELVKCPNKYPLALEPLLTQFVMKKEVPQPANDTRLISASVVDVNAALRVHDALVDNMPPTHAVVQVEALAEGIRKLVRVPLGMLMEDLVSNLPELSEKPAKMIIGGLFLGYAQFSFQVPIVQQVDVITLQSAEELHRTTNEPCFNCGYCVRHCPMQLLPNELGKYCEYGKFDDAERKFLFHCIECGLCAYVCPAKRPMVQLLRFGKQELSAMREAS